MQKIINQKIYSDIDLNFIPHPLTGDLVKVQNDKSIIQSIKSLLQTNFYDRLFNPTLASNINASLFELATPIQEEILRNDIRRCIEQWEPRAKILSLNVSFVDTDNAYNIYIECQIQGLPFPVTVDYILTRLR